MVPRVSESKHDINAHGFWPSRSEAFAAANLEKSTLGTAASPAGTGVVVMVTEIEASTIEDGRLVAHG